MKPIFRIGLVLTIIISFIFSSFQFVEPVEAHTGKDIIKEIRQRRFRPSGYGKENITEQELSKLIRIYEESQESNLRSKSRDKKPKSAMEANALTPLKKDSLAIKNKKFAWMLNPKVFKNLSTAGKRAALYRNGLLDLPNQSKTNLAASKVKPQLSSLGTNVRVNNPGLDTVLRTQSETSVAVRGSNVVASFNDIAVDRNTCGYSFSTDGGNTFAQSSIPEPGDQFNLGDGVVAYGPNGELYYALLALKGNNFTSIVGVTKSTDNGATFQGLGDASNTLNNDDNFHDKEWIAVDNSNAATRGNVYVSWTVFGLTDTFIAVSTSTDGGKTFGSPVNVSTNNNLVVQGSMPMVGPNGELYVAFSSITLNGGIVSSVSLVKSVDGGKTFSAPKPIAINNNFPFFNVTGGDGVRASAFPSLAVDKDGRIHVVYADFSSGATRDRSDIFYVRSTDSGNTFSTPLKINDDSTDTTQINPSVAVAGDGSVGIRWWDRRNDMVNDSLTDVYMAISKDNGASFGKNFRITDHNWVFSPSESGDYHGDYDGLTADDKNFYLSWSDERSGDPDVFFTQIATNRDPNLGDFNLSTTKVFDNAIAGGKVDYNITTSALNGSTDRLTLSAEPMITGITYSFSKTGLNAGESATLSVSTSSSTPAGTYFITLSATSNSSVRKTNLRLTVYGQSRRATLPTNISNTRGNSFGSIQMDSKNILHAVYEDDTERAAEGGTQVFYRQSLDGGKTYSQALRLSTSDDFFNTSPNLALDSSGNIYVIWVGDIQVLFTKSTDQGKTFSRPVGITPDTGFANVAAIAVDKNKNVMVSYNGFLASGQDGKSGVFVVSSSNAGTSFSKPTLIAENGRNTQVLTSTPYLAFNSKGTVFMVYNTATFGTTSTSVEVNMVMAKSGKKFKKAKVVSDSALQSFQPFVAVDQSDAVYISFYDVTRVSGASRRDIELVKSTNNGKTFSPKLKVSNSGRATAPYIAIDSQANPSVAWQEFSGVTGIDVFFASSSNKGQSFSSSTNLSGNSGASLFPSAAFDSNGTLFVSWTDDSNANTEVFVLSTPKN
ncbi:MAG: exo-alpha-sialidase [Acidobacteria bacterium]|nr:exo-alpha-sialidase [Acidobacteriota bacterium]